MFTPPPNAGREANRCHVCGYEAKRLDSGLCLLCSLIRRLASDTEPTLSSDRDTRDLEDSDASSPTLR